LGRARFFKETGVKKSDWDRHWDRWEDAVQEAGFKPNSKNEAIGDQRLIDKLINLIRELGHFPIENELRRKARSDPTFPSHGVFARFVGGLGPKLAAKVRSYCESHTGYDDVLALCPEIQQSQQSRSKDSEEKEFGFVYLIKSARYYKIGRSNAAGRREYELAIQLPERPKLIYQIRTDDPVGIEEYWHKRFADKRKNGEWFDLSSADVKAFTRRKFM
jgi:hypothetical protein